MNASRLAYALAAMVITSFAMVAPTLAQETSSQTSGEDVGDLWLSGGVDVTWFNVARKGSGTIGFWLGAYPTHNLRLRVRLATNLMGPGLAYYYPDSTVFDALGIASIRADVEWSGIKTGRLRWLIGVMAGAESVRHEYRSVPYGRATLDADQYFILEPWIGIRLMRGKNSHALRLMMECVTIAVGYRFPIDPNLPGYRHRAFSGLSTCLTLTGPQR